eukprot:TRINITY_DN5937_c0_g1_i1.p1 TRINITY_DN5937_c0_g1~~TRINITY_DN5937_c0_g1_i1.p1  ORF type:complete len:415 (-),score=60.49 TRINITY_DN5937_c0_g1_i1:614-1858(-)
MGEQHNMMQAAYEIAHQLHTGGGEGSDDEGGEVEDFGLGAMDPARMHATGVSAVVRLIFETESAQRAARRASSNNAASFAMTEQSWSSNDGTAARFLRFLALAYGEVTDGAESLEEQANTLACVLSAALSFRLWRFFALLREGGRALLVGGKCTLLSMATICNMASSLGHFYAKRSRDFAGQMPYVAGCLQRTEIYLAIPEHARSAAQIAAGETHRGKPLTDEAVAGWASGSTKRATRLGESAARTPPVTPDSMKTAFFLAMEGMQDGDADHPITTLMLERLVLFVVMAFSWCTMLEPDNLLGLGCRDVALAPNDDAANLAFMETHGHPRWVRGTATTPAYYFWSSMASDAEMRASAEFDSAGVCVRCPWTWCNLPFFTYLYIWLREAAPELFMSAPVPFFVTPVAAAAEDGGL